MRKLLLITVLLFAVSCSESDDQQESNMITAEEYGVIIKGPDVDYTYKFYTEPTGEILVQGERTGEQNLFFNVAESELKAENIYFEMQLTGKADEFEAYLISRKGDLYLNSEDNPNAKSIFEINNTSKSENTLYGVIPIRMDEHFWIKNSEWSNN